MMIPELKRRRISAIASNAVLAVMEVKANRVLMTDHDAATRDAVFDLLMSIQETAQAEIGETIPMVAPNQGEPDVRLDLVIDALQAAE